MMPDWLPATVAVVLSAAVLAARVARLHSHNVEHFDRQVNHLERFIAMTAQDTVNAVVATLNKARQEIVGAKDSLEARIADLQEQIEAGIPAEELDLSELSAAAQALDDIVPDAVDAPVEVPVEVPVEDAPAGDAPTEV